MPAPRGKKPPTPKPKTWARSGQEGQFTIQPVRGPMPPVVVPAAKKPKPKKKAQPARYYL